MENIEELNSAIRWNTCGIARVNFFTIAQQRSPV